MHNKAIEMLRFGEKITDQGGNLLKDMVLHIWSLLNNGSLVRERERYHVTTVKAFLAISVRRYTQSPRAIGICNNKQINSQIENNNITRIYLVVLY